MLPHLPYIAEFSKSVSIFIVLLLLVLMIAYLSRVSIFPDQILGGSSSVTWVQRSDVSQQPMLLMPNPFQLQVHQSSLSPVDMSPVIQIKASSHVPCHCVCWWCVDLRSLYALLAWPWPAFREAVLNPDQKGMPDICWSSEPLQCIQGDSDLELQIPSKLQNASCLGSPPRLRCPLVVFLINSDENSSSSSSGFTPRVVALVSVVHIRDSLVPMSTRVLNQFLKQNNGQVTTLQPLYVSGVSNQFKEEGASTSDFPDAQSDSDSCCVVCHCNAATLALLPCRHACLCPQCLPRLKDCPLCRAHIQSYFHVAQSHSYPTPDTGLQFTSESELSTQAEEVGPDTTVRLRNAALSS